MKMSPKYESYLLSSVIFFCCFLFSCGKGSLGSESQPFHPSPLRSEFQKREKIMKDMNKQIIKLDLEVGAIRRQVE